jgi:hypothetical protein
VLGRLLSDEFLNSGGHGLYYFDVIGRLESKQGLHKVLPGSLLCGNRPGSGVRGSRKMNEPDWYELKGIQSWQYRLYNPIDNVKLISMIMVACPPIDRTVTHAVEGHILPPC